MCAVTGLPAKYYDPLTQTPYANIEAFHVIRERYKQQKKQIEEELEKRRLEEEMTETHQEVGEQQRLESNVRQSLRRSNEQISQPALDSPNLSTDANDEESRRYNTRTRTPRSYSQYQ